MLFLKISNANVSFGKKRLTWKLYITKKALLTTEQVQLVDLREFVIVMLDVNSETFVIHVAIQKRVEMAMDPTRKTQIKAQIKAQSGGA